ncbi:MAG TPA: ribonuclease activity regulator RraA [Hyphomicrobiaceae bacterium]|nr:ribonuclease activity regulator RraA [Hyphomicrobiaceae bacterium]
MVETTVDDATIDALRGVSVATLTTCLYKRGFRNQFIHNVGPIDPDGRPMVGPAFTLRTIPAREDLATPEILGDRRYPARASIEACPPGHVLVIDCRQDPRSAAGGDILLTRLMVRGVEGCVTDGGFRDCYEIAELEFPAYQSQPSPPISLLHHHAIEMQVPIACGGAPVFPGDIMVGDGEGVVIVPAHLAADIAKEAVEMTAYEDFAADQVRQGAELFSVYPATDLSRAKFEAWRRERGR